jgi:hypothetical protein
MDSIDPIVQALQRLVAKEGGEAAVAAEIHSSKATIWQIVNGTKLESGRPRSVGRDLRERLDRRYPGWFDEAVEQREPRAKPDTPGAGLLKNALAQDLSHVTESINPITIQWELVLSVKLPMRFRLVIRDDSMALDDPPSMRTGHWAEFEPASDAPAGQVVLVADAAGNVYIRKKVEKTPGRWEAHARRAADYLPLDSVTDGLRILAVQVGQGWR